MTTREMINRRKRWVMIGFLLCIGTFVATGALGGSRRDPLFLFLGLPAVGVGVLLILWAQYFGLRCLSCGGNLAPLAFSRAAWSLNKRIRFCPYCGQSLDGDSAAAETDPAGDQGW